MSDLRVIPIVEGHGEVGAIRTLLTRIWSELLGGNFIEVLQPIRRPRTKLPDKDELCRTLDLAVSKLSSTTKDPSIPSLVLILLDANGDLPCEIGPRLLKIARMHRKDQNLSCVIANKEYETWLVAGFKPEHFSRQEDLEIPNQPEDRNIGKGWIQRAYPNYSETVDQPRLTARFDLRQCRDRSPSFDKLCRELERFL